MKLEQLRKVIREEVKSAMREELQEIMNEAVRAASTPQPGSIKNTGKKITYESPQKPLAKTSINELMEQTKSGMSSQEYRNVYSGTSDMASKPNFASSMANSMGMSGNTANQPGLDISQFDFVKKAGDVYNASVEKDKQKLGIV